MIQGEGVQRFEGAAHPELVVQLREDEAEVAVADAHPVGVSFWVPHTT